MGHLTKWLFFNLMFGAIPYALVVALNQLQTPGSPVLHPSSEVLFIAVVATSSALGELWDGTEYVTRAEARARARWQLVMLLGVLVSSLLYGAYVYATLSSPGRAHGVDCSAVAAWQAVPGHGDAWQSASIRQWGGTCALWARSEARFFWWSLQTTALWCAISTAAMYRYSPGRW